MSYFLALSLILLNFVEYQKQTISLPTVTDSKDSNVKFYSNYDLRSIRKLVNTRHDQEPKFCIPYVKTKNGAWRSFSVCSAPMVFLSIKNIMRSRVPGLFVLYSLF